MRLEVVLVFFGFLSSGWPSPAMPGYSSNTRLFLEAVGMTALLISLWDAAGNAYALAKPAPKCREAGIRATPSWRNFNPSGTAWVYYKEIGGSRYDSATGIAVDAAGNALRCCITARTIFPPQPVLTGRAAGRRRRVRIESWTLRKGACVGYAPGPGFQLRNRAGFGRKHLM